MELAAGINCDKSPAESKTAKCEGNPKLSNTFFDDDWKIRSIVREEISVYHWPPFLTMRALCDVMNPAGAWPPEGEDLDLSPFQLWKKYASNGL